jgi:hypothetical protein
MFNNIRLINLERQRSARISRHLVGDEDSHVVLLRDLLQTGHHLEQLSKLERIVTTSIYFKVCTTKTVRISPETNSSTSKHLKF